MAEPTARRIEPAALARWPWAAASLLLLAWAGATALRAWRSDALVSQARAELAAPQGRSAAPAGAPSPREILRRAVEIDGSNPEAVEMLALMRASRLDSRAELESGLAGLRDALRLRPASAQSWANLARARYEMGDVGGEFQAALAQAARLGPHEPAVQRTVIDYGMAAWDEIAPPLRTQLEGMIAAAARRDPAETLQLAQRRGRLGVACRHLAGASRLPGSNSALSCAGEATP